MQDHLKLETPSQDHNLSRLSFAVSESSSEQNENELFNKLKPIAKINLLKKHLSHRFDQKQLSLRSIQNSQQLIPQSCLKVNSKGTLALQSKKIDDLKNKLLISKEVIIISDSDEEKEKPLVEGQAHSDILLSISMKDKNQSLMTSSEIEIKLQALERQANLFPMMSSQDCQGSKAAKRQKKKSQRRRITLFEKSLKEQKFGKTKDSMSYQIFNTIESHFI